jgi:hypothetical protein
VQAFFEPDYGSALKHLSPMLPLILYPTWFGMPDRGSTQGATRAIADVSRRQGSL